jgi:hypothetical protein
VSVLAAAVVLAWVCLVVLTLAMAGMLRQLRELQYDVARLSSPQPRGATGRTLAELAGTGPLMLLVLDPGCSFCDVVREPFTQLARSHPGTRFEVLAAAERWPSVPEVRSRVDQDLVAELDLPWAPALLLADDAGTVRATQPVHSPQRIGEQVGGLLSSELSAPNQGGGR